MERITNDRYENYLFPNPFLFSAYNVEYLASLLPQHFFYFIRMSIYRQFGGMNISFTIKSSDSVSSQSPIEISRDKKDISVFISYSSYDRPKVLEVEVCLKRAGITAWIDRKFIDGGDNYGSSIVDGIRNSKALLIMCSSASMRSRNVRQEIMLAWKYEKPYLPLLIDEYLLSTNGFPEQVAYWLEGSQWIEILDSPCTEWVQKVVISLQKLDAVPVKGAISSGTPAPKPIIPHHSIHGLLSLARFTDQIWPVPADRSNRAMTRSGYRDLGAPQDEASHVFRRGDKVSILIESETEGYLTLLDVGTSGKVYSLCPSQFAPDTRIHKGMNEYPQRDAPYRSFSVTGNPGREQILALISREPLNTNLMPDKAEIPAKVLTHDEIEGILTELRQRESADWMALSTYFDLE